MADDSELLRQIQQGREDAFAALVDRHGDYLHGVAHALVGNATDAEDLVQETFAAVLRGGFRGEASVRTWMVKILVRQNQMLRRSRWRRSKHLKLFGANVEKEKTSDTKATDAKLDLAEMLKELTKEHRAVIVLREIEGLSYEEMAEVLGVPRGTVESRLHRAREDLRKKCKGYV